VPHYFGTPANGGMVGPTYLEAPRHNFFPMFPFGGMGRHESRALQGGPPQPPPPQPPTSVAVRMNT
jgi:hypothetical protein